MSYRQPDINIRAEMDTAHDAGLASLVGECGKLLRVAREEVSQNRADGA